MDMLKYKTTHEQPTATDMIDDFERHRPTLVREARQRIRARKRRGPKLARLYDDLILATLAVFDAYDQSRPFYENGSPVEDGSLISRAMDIYNMPCLLELWSDLTHTPPKSLANCPPTAAQYDALLEVTHALEDLLYAIAGNSNTNRFDCLSDEWLSEYGNEKFRWQYWNLLNLTVEVSIREVDIFFDHPEEWKQELTETSASSPVAFMFDGSIDARKELWEEVKAKFRSSNARGNLGASDIILKKEPADYPLAFCTFSSRHILRRYDHNVARALSHCDELKIDYDNQTIMWAPCHIFTQAVFSMRWNVVDYFRRARAKCKPTSLAYRKWLEAEAEMLAFCTFKSKPLTPEAAERIVAMAHSAARETWIDARCKTRTIRKDAALEKLLRQTTMSVRLVDVDDLAGKSLRQTMKDPGGRPRKTQGGAKILSQAEMAVAFGPPCNESMVANWEARAAGKARGANPPDAVYNGEKIIYSAELRKNPTPENKNRLTALIVEFQSRHRLRQAVDKKSETIHCRSDETLAKASGQTDAAVRNQSQLKYGK